MESKGLWDDSKNAAWIAEAKKNVMSTFGAAEKRPKPDWSEMFKDVYQKMPKHLM